MPKVTMTFNLPEEESDYDIAKNGLAYYCAIDEIKQRLRETRKYNRGIVDPKWVYKRGKRKGEVKKRFEPLVNARLELFEDLDRDLLDIILELPNQN